MRLYALLFAIYALLILAIVVPYTLTILSVTHKLPH